MVTIRPAAPRDAEGVARTHVASWQGAYRGLVDDAYLDALHWSQRYPFWSAQLTRPSIGLGGTWVAVSEDTVVGFASIGPARDEDRQIASSWELYGIYLLPDRWGTGLGRDLLVQTLRVTPSEVADVSLWVLAANGRARHFYERQAFERDGFEKVESVGGRRVNEVRYLRPQGGRRGPGVQPADLPDTGLPAG